MLNYATISIEDLVFKFAFCRFIKQNKVKKRLDSNDDYFGETAMKARNPLLYDQLIGKFLTKEEKEDAARPDMTTAASQTSSSSTWTSTRRKTTTRG